jgi:hypothetical protein
MAAWRRSEPGAREGFGAGPKPLRRITTSSASEKSTKPNLPSRNFYPADVSGFGRAIARRVDVHHRRDARFRAAAVWRSDATSGSAALLETPNAPAAGPRNACAIRNPITAILCRTVSNGRAAIARSARPCAASPTRCARSDVAWTWIKRAPIARIFSAAYSYMHHSLYA